MGAKAPTTNLPVSGLKASEKVFGKTDRKAKEIERLNNEIKKLDEESKNIKQKMNNVNAKLMNLEKDLKESKLGDTSKLKLLLEKSENSDKLITALKQEITRLKKAKENMILEEEKNPKPKKIETVLVIFLYFY